MHSQQQLPSGNAGEQNPSPNPRSLGSTLSFYDLALAVVPLPLVVGLLAQRFLASTPGAGVAVGGLGSALVVGYLLFGNPPMRPGSSENGTAERHGPPRGPSA